jgi:protein gp37
MSDGTKISWSDATWNPISGCSKVSDGCLNCYIDRTPPFRMAHRKFNGREVGATTGVMLHSERLGIPLKWRKPRMIFVCSLADLFQDEVPDRFIADVFAVISLGTQHVFQVLTKRHARMRSLLNSPQFWALVDAARQVRGFAPLPGDAPHILENAWIGVSTENQKWADVRIPALLQTPAAVRWISAEPLLGPISLRGWVERLPVEDGGYSTYLDWAVIGGESGPQARPMHPDWARALRDQCVASGVSYHFKQWGEWTEAFRAQASHLIHVNGTVIPRGDGTTDFPYGSDSGRDQDLVDRGHQGWIRARRVGKKAAGRDLDGRTWDEYPRELVNGAA